jgi:hypothetical protein
MGVDVYGRKPRSDVGTYWGTNWDCWRPIHNLMREACSDLLGEEELKDIEFSNDGHGPTSQQICTETANRLNSWAIGQETEGETQGEGDEETTPEAPLKGEPSGEYFPYEALKEWIKFLRNCGGFKVW